MHRRLLVEALEPRRLLAGVILLDTGRLGNNTGWMAAMATDITANLGGPAQVPQFTLLITANPTTGALVPSISQVAYTGTPQTNSSGEILVLVNYFTISANASYSSTAIGQVIGNFLLTTPVDGVLLASLPIHEIGLSRGTALFDGTNLVLGQAGVWVDQETYLDPDPIAAQGDPPSTLYSNVEFADDYWRNDGSASQDDDGNPVSGAYNLNVYWLDSEDAGWPEAHIVPAGYYIGTIDQNATTAIDGPIYSEWYGDTPTMPAQNATGWIYSDLVGAPRPLSGVWAASGGTGTRTPTGQSGTQWGNVADLTVTSGATFASGTPLTASFIHQDRGSADTVTFYLDTDRNPYDGTFADTLGTVNLAQTNTTAQATETLSTAGVAPGTYWLCAQVTNTAGDTRYEYESITAPLNVTALINPVATLTSPAALTAAGSAAETLVVTYTGSAPINVNSFSNSNLQVSGPGVTELAKYVGVDGNTGSDTRVATYSVPAPAGGWVAADNGVYTVSVQANQVDDTSSRYVAAGALGTFNVNLPLLGEGSLAGSQATAAAGYNLTAIGTSDWAHWGRGGVYGNFDHDATGNSQISNVNVLGTGQVGGYSDSSRSVSWSNGTPTTSDTGDDGYIWANNALGAGFSFTVPADTNTRTLEVYAGGYSSGATLTAHLSDGSAADYVATASGSGTYANIYTITYKAASAGQTLTISYVKSATIGDASGSVDLIAAMLAGGPSVSATRPTATLTSAAPITAATASPYTFNATYTDSLGINASTIGNQNIVVTGTGYSQAATLVSTGLSNSPTIVATYSVPAPAGGWATSTNGSYTITLQANQVADTSGNFAAGPTSLGTFAVSIPMIAGPLSDSDIGSPGDAGSATYNSSTGVWTIAGGGADIWNAFDQFNFASTPVSGNATLIAEVTSLTNTDPWAKAGLMFRDGAGATAANVALVATAGNGVSFQWRSTPGGTSSYTNIPGVPIPTASAPIWLELVRTGNVFTASYSTNGTNYTVVGTQTITLDTTLLAGLAVTSHNDGLLTTATFANVAVPYTGTSVSAPGAPTLVASPATAAVNLSWNPVAGAVSYNLYRSTTAGAEGTTPYITGISGTAYSDTAVTVGTPCYYKLTAVNSGGEGAPSSEVSATPTASTSIGSLSDSDIGSPGDAGSASYNNSTGVWTVAGGGADIWNASDQFNFASTPVSGNATLIAEVTSLTNTDPWAKAGLMFRDGASASAANVALVATAGNGVSFQWRSTPGGTSSYTNIPGVPIPTASAPIWLQLVRTGNVFTASYSINGTNYTVVGTQTITLDATLLAGLAVTSHNNGLLNTATFANVAVPYTGTSVSVPGAPTLVASPATGAVNLSWSPVAGAVSYNLYRSTTAGAEGTTPYITGISGTAYSDTAVTVGTPYYYKLTAVNSGGEGAPSSEVSATPTASTSIGSLSDSDIGSPGDAGSASYNSSTGVWTIAGGGADIWNASDQFNFASTPVSGNATLIAEVTSLTNTDPWAKAGLMFRDGASASAANVALVATAGNGVSFQWRSTPGGTSSYTNIPGVPIPTASAPIWLQLVRTGNVFTASYSTNGTNYTLVGTQTITLDTTLLAGLAVTSHNNGLLNTATFANVSV
jgi:fibronectin type 3 domain-containing protein